MLPASGGWMDQTKTFLRMVEFCDDVHVKMSAVKKEARIELEQMIAMRGKHA